MRNVGYSISSAKLKESMFPLEKAIELILPGNQWKELLALLADSEDGKSAQKKDLLVKFKYLKEVPREGEFEDYLDQADRMGPIKKATNSLPSAIGNLTRRLREQVQAGDDVKRENLPMSAKPAKTVEALFTTGYLFHHQDGKLHFREPCNA